MGECGSTLLRVPNIATVHGFTLSPERALLHLRPLLVDDRAGVADERARTAPPEGDREETAPSRTAGHDLRLGSAPLRDVS